MLKEATVVTVSRDGVRLWNREGALVARLPCPLRPDTDVRHCTVIDPYIVAAQGETLLVWNLATVAATAAGGGGGGGGGGGARLRHGHQADIVGFATGPLLPSEKGPYRCPTLLSVYLMIMLLHWTVI